MKNKKLAAGVNEYIFVPLAEISGLIAVSAEDAANLAADNLNAALEAPPHEETGKFEAEKSGYVYCVDTPIGRLVPKKESEE